LLLQLKSIIISEVMWNLILSPWLADDMLLFRRRQRTRHVPTHNLARASHLCTCCPTNRDRYSRYRLSSTCDEMYTVFGEHIQVSFVSFKSISPLGEKSNRAMPSEMKCDDFNDIQWDYTR
jgi:hypothetical protein